MKIQIVSGAFSYRALVLGALTLISTLSVPVLGLRPAMAHEAPCPYCNMAVSDDTAAVLKSGRKRIEYKCVYCALAEAKTEYPNGDVKITAPSEKKGQSILLQRTGGKWSAQPASATFVAPAKIKHKVCQAQARAFISKSAAQAFAKSSGGMVMTLSQMNDMAK